MGSDRCGSCLGGAGRRSWRWTACAPLSADEPASSRGFRRATYRARRNGQGLNTVVMFLLVLQVKLCKRLDVARVTNDLDGSVYA